MRWFSRGKAEKPNNILAKIQAQGGNVGYYHQADNPPIVLSLEDFFGGNPHPDGSIAANMAKHPGREGFFKRLKSIRGQDGVQDILVGVTQVEAEKNPDLIFPYSDQVFLLARTSKDQIAGWFGELQPDEITDISQIWSEWRAQKPAFLPETRAGYSAYSIWWD